MRRARSRAAPGEPAGQLGVERRAAETAADLLAELIELGRGVVGLRRSLRQLDRALGPVDEIHLAIASSRPRQDRLSARATDPR
jgi:hypothetical protein